MSKATEKQMNAALDTIKSVITDFYAGHDSAFMCCRNEIEIECSGIEREDCLIAIDVLEFLMLRQAEIIGRFSEENAALQEARKDG